MAILDRHIAVWLLSLVIVGSNVRTCLCQGNFRSSGWNTYVGAGGPPNAAIDWPTQGGNYNNTRNVTVAGLSNLTLHLSVPSFNYSLPNVSTTASPLLSSNLIIFPSWNGTLRGVQRLTGAALWELDVGMKYYGASSKETKKVTFGPAIWDRDFALLGVGHPADMLMIRMRDGSLVWIVNADEHPLSAIKGSGTVFGNTFYAGVDSDELEFSENNANYTCCTFVGSMVSVDLRAGRLRWKTRSICANISGAGNFSGAGFPGSTPPVNPDLGLVFAATGSNYNVSADYFNCTNSTPPQDVPAECDLPYYACNYADSVIAFDMNNGTIVWIAKLTPWISWNMTCGLNVTDASVNCLNSSTNYSGAFAMNPASDRWCRPPFNLVKKRIQAPLVCTPALYVVQKSGILFNLDSATGDVNWSNQTSPPGRFGGSVIGVAVDDSLVYLGVVNYDHLNWTLVNGTVINGGGWAAHYKTSGSAAWNTANPAFYDPSGLYDDPSSNGRSATSGGYGAPLSLSDVVLVTSGDTVYVPDYGTGVPTNGNGGGWVYALNKTDGTVSSSFETSAGTTSSFSANSQCAYVGNGGPVPFAADLGLPNGTAVFAWCSRGGKAILHNNNDDDDGDNDGDDDDSSHWK
jgi:polyvinyl alcohol dehydrogenase (cytochrome)